MKLNLFQKLRKQSKILLKCQRVHHNSETYQMIPHT